MAEYGLLTEVAVEPRTTELASDAAVSATELEVVDAGDFDPDNGGQLILNGVLLDYTSVVWGSTEDDTDLIELAIPLTVAADAGDPVQSTAGDVGEEDWYALVDMGGGGAAVAVPIRFEQRLAYTPGIYDPPVPAIVSEDLSRIEDLPGRSPGTAVQFYDDTFIIAATGEQELSLTYQPLDRSEHLYWHPGGLAGVYQQQGDQWDIDGVIVTIHETGIPIAIGDKITVEYAYMVGAPTGVVTPDDPTPPPDPDPDPGATVITPTNAVTLNSTPSWGGVVDGAPPQWGDGSDGTGAAMFIRYGTSVVNKRQTGSTTFDAQPSLVVDPAARVAVWYSVTSVDLEYGFDIIMQPSSLSSVKLEASPDGANGLAAPAGWTVVEMLAVAGSSIEAFLAAWQSTPEELQINPNWPIGAEPPGVVTKHIGIGEVRVAIYYP